MTDLRRTPFRASLTQGKTIAGVEAQFIIANGTIAVAMVMGASQVYWIPVAWLLHQLLKKIYQADPNIRLVYIRYARQADRYDPWPRINQIHNHRPQGWGRYMLC